MSKQRNNLERLLRKMETRYGANDEVVVLLQQALVSLERRTDDSGMKTDHGGAAADASWLSAMRSSEQRLS